MKKPIIKLVAPAIVAALPVHPYADQYPMRPLDQLKLLGEDMAANGQNEPVVVCDGVLIDGRNRLRAAELAGIEVLVQYLTGKSQQQIDDLIVAYNIRRRHMRPSQRAAMALEDYRQERKAGKKVTLEQMAARHSVSLRTLHRLNAEQQLSGAKAKISMARIPAKLRLLPRLLRDMAKLTDKTRGTERHRRLCADLQSITREIWSRPELYESLDYAGERPGQS